MGYHRWHRCGTRCTFGHWCQHFHRWPDDIGIQSQPSNQVVSSSALVGHRVSQAYGNFAYCLFYSQTHKLEQDLKFDKSSEMSAYLYVLFLLHNRKTKLENKPRNKVWKQVMKWVRICPPSWRSATSCRSAGWWSLWCLRAGLAVEPARKKSRFVRVRIVGLSSRSEKRKLKKYWLRNQNPNKILRNIY